MNEINCDINHIEEAIETAREGENTDRIHVWDSDCVMRGISREEMKDRNCHHNAESVCYIEEEVPGQFSFKFHQNQIDTNSEFCLRPPGVDEIDPDYHTDVKSLGENLKRVVEQLEDIYSDLIWDLAEISGASYAQGGHITDFEFEFEIVAVQ